MSAKQRHKNRRNAKMLADNAVICPECGERGRHWVVVPSFWFERDSGGFWVCPRLYENGRRIDE